MSYAKWKITGWGILGITLLIILIIGTTFGNLWYKGYFGTKFADVERDIWENTKSRVNSAVQDINAKYLEYNKAEDVIEKKAICAYLRNSYPTLPLDKIPDYKLRLFFENCKYGDIR